MTGKSQYLSRLVERVSGVVPATARQASVAYGGHASDGWGEVIIEPPPRPAQELTHEGSGFPSLRPKDLPHTEEEQRPFRVHEPTPPMMPRADAQPVTPTSEAMEEERHASSGDALQKKSSTETAPPRSPDGVIPPLPAPRTFGERSKQPFEHASSTPTWPLKEVARAAELPIFSGEPPRSTSPPVRPQATIALARVARDYQVPTNTARADVKNDVRFETPDYRRRAVPERLGAGSSSYEAPSIVIGEVRVEVSEDHTGESRRAKAIRQPSRLERGSDAGTSMRHRFGLKQL
ncbi:MAG TPA: hypothetical protein VMT95_12735 [Candidatus Binatia bacterium]|nr:hypothetical protein [Candidatus Binatia bacterium]